MIRKLIAIVFIAVAGILVLALETKTEQPQIVKRAKAPQTLGNSYRDPDNRQAQSQKKEGTILCPPFCAPPEVASVQQKGRWHAE